MLSKRAGLIISTADAVCDSVLVAIVGSFLGYIRGEGEDYALNSKRLKEVAKAAKNPAWLCFVWFGMTGAISLLEAPVKFTAPLLTRPVALDVGRVVFQALNQAELVALIVLLILVRVSGLARAAWGWVSVLTLIMLMQSIWLLPELAERAQMIASGTEPPQSATHAIYAVLELIKLGILLSFGFWSLSTMSTRACGKPG